MKKIFYYIIALTIVCCSSCKRDKPKEDLNDISDFIKTEQPITIDIDTVLENGKTQYYLYCETKDVWDKVSIEDSVLLFNGIYAIPHINLKSKLVHIK